MIRILENMNRKLKYRIKNDENKYYISSCRAIDTFGGK